jgi:hypothetical protein
MNYDDRPNMEPISRDDVAQACTLYDIMVDRQRWFHWSTGFIGQRFCVCIHTAHQDLLYTMGQYQKCFINYKLLSRVRPPLGSALEKAKRFVSNTRFVI